MNNAIFPLFPCPLMICASEYAFSDDELRFFASLEFAENVGNSMSNDDRVLDRDELKRLRRFIDEQVDVYKRKLLRIPDHNEIYITQSWVNRSGPGEFHPKHKHPNSVISGVMFLDDNVADDLPSIRFHRAQELFPLQFKFDELNDFNAQAREFDPVQGMLMLFPSLLEHDVDRNVSGKVRTSLSFNTFVRGTVGGRNQLTEVDIA